MMLSQNAHLTGRFSSPFSTSREYRPNRASLSGLPGISLTIGMRHFGHLNSTMGSNTSKSLLNALIFCSKSGRFLSSSCARRTKLTPLEASYRELDTKPTEAIRDVLKLTARYATLDTSIASPDDKKVEAFQQFFVSQSQRLPLFEWASRALRIRFMTRLAGMTLGGSMGANEVVENLAKARSLAESLNSIQGTKINEVRTGLLKIITEKPAYFRELKGKHLSRVFWEVATIDNLDKVESLLA